MSNIYLLFSCDEWKSHSSMSLVMASTNESKIRAEVKRQIKNKDMEYEADKKDLDTQDLNYIDRCLQYGYIEIVVDGERQ